MKPATHTRSRVRALLVVPLIAALVAATLMSSPAEAATKRSVKRSLSLSVSTGSITLGSSVRLFGRVTKSPKRSVVRIQVLKGKKWTTAKTLRTTSKQGTFALNLTPKEVGSYRYRASAPKSSKRRAAVSKTRIVRVVAVPLAPVQYVAPTVKLATSASDVNPPTVGSPLDLQVRSTAVAGSSVTFERVDGSAPTTWQPIGTAVVAADGSASLSIPGSYGVSVYRATVVDKKSALSGSASARVRVAGSTWRDVAAGRDHSCGIRTDGSLWCWGSANQGKLGGTSVATATPARVGTATNWRSVVVGDQYSCAIRTDKTLWCWGSDEFGQLGIAPSDGDDGDSTYFVSQPTQIDTGGQWASVSAGVKHTCGIKSDSTLWCWGSTLDGRLGDGSDGDGWSAVPTQESTASTWTSVSVGASDTCAIKADRTLWCWGSNAGGKLGPGVTGSATSPRQVGGSSDWAAVSAGPRHTCGIRSGDLFCWGDGSDGTIEGDDSGTIDRAGAADGWVSVTTGDDFSCASKPGTVQCWGTGGRGQLGNGQTSTIYSPVDVAGTATWTTTVSAGSEYVLAVDAAGLLWAWGRGDSGQLGTGDTSDQLAPYRGL